MYLSYKYYLAVFLSVFLLSIGNTVGQSLDSTYTNPISSKDLPDMTVWDGEDGYYYMYYTNVIKTNATLYKSDNLVDWEDSGIRPFSDNTMAQIKSLFQELGGGINHFFAPQVHKIGDYWVMYISLKNKATIALRSKSPTGDFQFKDNTPSILVRKGVHSNSVEDGFYVKDMLNRKWLFFGSHSIYRIRLSDDGMELKSGAEPVLVAGNSEDTFCAEGAFVYERKGFYYLFFAQGLYDNTSYKVAVGRSRFLKGTYFDKEGNVLTKPKKDGKRSGTVVVKHDGNERYTGIAHSGEIFTDLDGRTYIFIPRWDKKKGIRNPWLLELKWDSEGWPYIDEQKPQYSGKRPRLSKTIKR